VPARRASETGECIVAEATTGPSSMRLVTVATAASVVNPSASQSPTVVG
jgi:hypothetical protein